MFLAIDIGNTSITLGVLKRLKVVQKLDLPTGAKTVQLQAAFLKLKRQFRSLDSTVICSVVPQATRHVEKTVRAVWGTKAIVIGRDVIVPIKNLYRNPKQVGQDRLVGAYAALKLYGRPAIIIDLGTAITFDIISRKKEYMGGIIVPGIKLSADTLFQKTALLPLVHIKQPQALIGKDTEGSILSGIFYGYGEMIRGLITLLSKKVIKGKPKVIITGGYTDLMKRYIVDRVSTVDQDLVMKGMALLATG